MLFTFGKRKTVPVRERFFLKYSENYSANLKDTGKVK